MASFWNALTLFSNSCTLLPVADYFVQQACLLSAHDWLPNLTCNLLTLEAVIDAWWEGLCVCVCVCVFVRSCVWSSCNFNSVLM